MWRVLRSPGIAWRCVIWCVGLLLHGFWAFVLGTNLLHGKPPPVAAYLVFWWGAIASICLVALVVEPRRPAAM